MLSKAVQCLCIHFCLLEPPFRHLFLPAPGFHGKGKSGYIFKFLADGLPLPKLEKKRFPKGNKMLGSLRFA